MSARHRPAFQFWFLLYCTHFVSHEEGYWAGLCYGSEFWRSAAPGVRRAFEFRGSKAAARRCHSDMPMDGMEGKPFKSTLFLFRQSFVSFLPPRALKERDKFSISSLPCKCIYPTYARRPFFVAEVCNMHSLLCYLITSTTFDVMNYRVEQKSCPLLEYSRSSAAEGKRPASVCLSAIFEKVDLNSCTLAPFLLLNQKRTIKSTC